jgi:hypothetical protein
MKKRDKSGGESEEGTNITGTVPQGANSHFQFGQKITNMSSNCNLVTPINRDEVFSETQNLV